MATKAQLANFCCLLYSALSCCSKVSQPTDSTASSSLSIAQASVLTCCFALRLAFRFLSESTSKLVVDLLRTFARCVIKTTCSIPSAYTGIDTMHHCNVVLPRFVSRCTRHRLFQQVSDLIRCRFTSRDNQLTSLY